MAESAGTTATPTQSQRPPRPGGTDTLTQLLDDGLQPLEGSLPGQVLTWHPWETPPEEEPGEQPLTPASGEGQESVLTPTPALRYHNQEEAERAEREAQQRITEETQRRAALERELELYRQHNALLERQIQQGAQTPTTEPGQQSGATAPQQPPPPFSAKEHFRQAYQRMGTLNPAAEDFETQQQQIFIDALDTAFSHLSSTTALTDAQINERIQVGIQAALPTMQQQVRQQTERERLLDKLASSGTTRGLDMTEGGEQYQDIMYAVQRNLYPANATEDEAIAYVIDRVAQLRGVAQTPPAGSPPADGARPAPTTPPGTSPQRAQALNTPMERSGMGRPQQAPDEMDTRSFSLSEVLDRSMRVRRP